MYMAVYIIFSCLNYSTTEHQVLVCIFLSQGIALSISVVSDSYIVISGSCMYLRLFQVIDFSGFEILACKA